MLKTSLALAIMSGIAVVLFNAMPVFLGVIAETTAFDNAKLGSLVSSYLAGHTLMTIVAGIALQRFNLRIAGVSAALLTAICFLLLTTSHNYHWMITMLFLAGLGGGTVFVISMAAMVRGERATRNVGLCLFMQVSAGALAVYISPVLIIPQWGLNGMLIFFAILFSLIIVLMLAFVSSEELNSALKRQNESHERMVFEMKPLISLVALTLYFTGMSAVWAFVERIGDAAGFEPVFVGTVLTASLLAAGLASLLAMVLENRLGIRIPLVFGGSILLVVLVTLANIGASDKTPFALSVIGFQFAWTFAFAYVASSIAWLDRSGMHTPLISAFMGLGAILGPVLGGYMGANSYLPAIILGISSVILMLLLLVVSPLLKGVRQLEPIS